jgi:predicted lactoylglutathione lyase
VDQRISLVTLAVEDPHRARAFYAAMGWEPRSQPDEDITFYQAEGMGFALWRRSAMAAETVGEVHRGSTLLAYNVRSEEEVDSELAAAEAAGGSVVKPARRMEWGGYSGTFADPDENQWEVAHNPSWSLDERGRVTIP